MSKSEFPTLSRPWMVREYECIHFKSPQWVYFLHQLVSHPLF